MLDFEKQCCELIHTFHEPNSLLTEMLVFKK